MFALGCLDIRLQSSCAPQAEAVGKSYWFASVHLTRGGVLHFTFEAVSRKLLARAGGFQPELDAVSLTACQSTAKESTMRFAGLCCMCLAASLAACSSVPTPDASKADVAAAGQAWATATNACELDKVLQLYHPEAVLWGTTSPTIAASPAGIRQYFDRTCNSGMNAKVAFGEQNIRLFGDTAQNSGIYNVTVVIGGQTRVLPTRYSFAYRRINGQWLIVNHHSSLMPTPPPQRQ